MSTIGACLNEEYLSGDLVGESLSDDEILSKMDRFVELRIHSFRGILTLTLTHPNLPTCEYKVMETGHCRRPFHGVRDYYFKGRMPSGNARQLGLTLRYE